MNKRNDERLYYDNIIVDIFKKWDGVGKEVCGADVSCVSITTVMGYRVDKFFDSDGLKRESRWYSSVISDNEYANAKYEYDDKGRLITIITNRSNQHLGRDDEKNTLEFQYDENDKVIFEIYDGVKYKIEYDENLNAFCDDPSYREGKLCWKWSF